MNGLNIYGPAGDAAMASLVSGEMARREQEAREALSFSATDIFAGIDGTGTYLDKLYESLFADSFVCRIHRTWDTQARFYRRGPGLDGTSTISLGKAAFSYILPRYLSRTEEPKRIFLAGYSRGATSVIHTAELLAQKNIHVDGLFLFDGVDRQVRSVPKTLPANVRVCFHARRRPDTNSRNIFGSYGTTVTPGSGTLYFERFFFCTHGGMGGVPWREGDEDGIINESRSSTPDDHVLESAVTALGAIAGTAGILAAREAYQKSGRTNVRVEQDSANSKVVWSWMSTALQSLRKNLPPVGAGT